MPHRSRAEGERGNKRRGTYKNMECSRCGSQNIKTFEMAHASYNVGSSSWDSVVKFSLLGPLGLLIKPNRNSVAHKTAPPENTFPILAVVFCFLFFSTLIWLINIYQRRGLVRIDVGKQARDERQAKR